jgi:hypothetical protein
MASQRPWQVSIPFAEGSMKVREMASEQDRGYVHSAYRTQGPVRLEVGSEELIPPPERLRLQEGLQAALVAAGVGEVIGGNSLSEPNENCLRSSIQVEVSDLEAGVRVMRHALRELKVPPVTWIWQHDPQEVCYQIWIDENNPPRWGW